MAAGGGPIIFAHRRVGFGGRSFYCYKFRTMRSDAAQALEKYLAENPDAAREWRERKKLKHDPRVTFFGRLLRLSSLDDEFAEAPAPAGVLERVEARLFPSAAPPRRVGLWESLAFWRGLAAAGFAVAVVAVGFNLFVPRPLPTGEELVAALEAEGSSLKLVAFYDQRAGTVRIAALSGAAVPGKDYELWAIRGASPAVSMGVIPVDSKSDIRLTDALKRDLAPGTVLAVTLEPKGGSPTGVATGPIVAKGVAIPI